MACLTLPVSSLESFGVIVGGGIVCHPATAPTQVLYVAPGASGNEVAIGGDLWEVTYVATGRFKVTLLANEWSTSVLLPVSLSTVVDINASLQLSATANLKVTVSNVNLAAGSFELDVTNPNTGVLTNPASNAGNIIHWKLRQVLGGPKTIRTL